MKNIFTLFAFLGLCGWASAQCEELFISEYVEGSHNNKVIEIYNPSLVSIDLTNYRIIRWSNGSTTSGSDGRYVQELTGSVISGGTYLIALDRLDPQGTDLDTMLFTELQDIVNASNHGYYSSDYNSGLDGSRTLSFNGDDAFSLEKTSNGGTSWAIVDIFGLIGEQPITSTGGTGAGWTDEPNYWDGNGAYWTRNKTLIRKADVQEGLTANPGGAYSIPGAFNPSVEYDSLPINTFDSLGKHTSSCPCYVDLDTVSVTAASCDGGDGALEIVVSGGTMPYSYDWAASGVANFTSVNAATLTGLSGGVYTASVRDYNGCRGTLVVNVVSPASVAINVTTSNDSCGSGVGSATINMTSGFENAPFTYSWNDQDGQNTETAINLTAGDYVGIVTDAYGCVAIAETATVGGSSAISLDFTTSASTCGGATGSAVVAATTNGGATYLWSDGGTTAIQMNIASGTYTVTVTDGQGCEAIETIVIEDEGAPVVQSTVNADLQCNGDATGTVDLSALGGATPYSFSWNGGAANAGITTMTVTGLGAGEYNAVVTGNDGCIGGVSVVITEPEMVVVYTSVSEETPVTNDGAVDTYVTGGTAPYTYAWGSGETTDAITGVVAGSYSIVVTDDNGCTGQADATVAYNTIGELSTNEKFQVYPNPASGVNITLDVQGIENIEITNVAGAVVLKQTILENITRIDVTSLKAGIYFVKGSLHGDRYITEKLVIE